MKIGVVTFCTDRGVRPDELAAAVEDRRLDSLFVTEHTHLPVEHGPPPWGGDVGEEYGRTLDPFVALAAAATATRRILLGTAISLIAQHDPIAAAKAIASVDHLAAGRLLIGVGFGWCRPELEHHGARFDERHRRVADHVGAMRALWQPEPTAFDSPTVSFGPSIAHPKPVAGAVPVYLGAPPGRVTTQHLNEWANGWMPSDRPTLIPAIERLDAGRGETGLPPTKVIVVGPAPHEERLRELASAGVEQVLLWLPPWPSDAVLRALDEHAQLARKMAE